MGPNLIPSEEVAEATRLLQGLIRIDSTNPPGNEGKCAEFLKACFDREGIECEVIGERGRENALAKIAGRREKPRLLLLSHTDVVPATNVGTWKHPPFSGIVDGRWIYGRGALDDKFDVATQAMVLILVRRRRISLNGTLLYAAVADEEVNGQGAEWLTRTEPSKVSSEYVVGEGGGPAVKIGRTRAYRVCTGEKGLVWFRLTAKGRAGHGSIPTLADNANLKMAKAFVSLSNYKTRVKVHENVNSEIKLVTSGLFGERQASRLLKHYPKAAELDRLLDRISLKDRELAEELRALTRMTISPTVIHGGTETNVIPAACEGKVDIRLIPGQDEDDAIQVVRQCVKGLGVDIEAYQYSPASVSPTHTLFYEAIRSTLEEMTPGSLVLPQISTGMSDSRFWRRLASVVYGCVPMSPKTKPSEVIPGVHGPNERVDVASLAFGTSFLCKLVPRALS